MADEAGRRAAGVAQNRMMSETDAAVAVAERYARFARDEAPGRSELYADWAAGVAGDAAVPTVLARIAPEHRHPPLVFAVSRLLGAPEGPFVAWREWVLRNADALVAECGRRGLQTNEPLRCAALLPALSALDGPLALIEVGASAGLCLFPDRYSYRYATHGGEVIALDPDDGPSTVVLHSALRGDERPPLRMPKVAWRAGIDLHPLDARNPHDRNWLTTLVWPGEQGRAERLHAALDIAADDPPIIHHGDAAELLGAVAATSPSGVTLVVTTPGVLVHAAQPGRDRIIDTARDVGRWITLDAPSLHSAWHPPIDAGSWPPGAFALALDGDVLAAVDPLGGFVEWRGGDRRARR